MNELNGRIDLDMSWDLLRFITSNNSLHRACLWSAYRIGQRLTRHGYCSDAAAWRIFQPTVKKAITLYRRECGPVRLVSLDTKRHLCGELVEAYIDDAYGFHYTMKQAGVSRLSRTGVLK